MNPRREWLLMLAIVFTGCDSAVKDSQNSKENAPEAFDRIIPEDLIAAWGYRTISTGIREQSKWEAEAFGEAAIRVQSIKAVEAVPDWEDAYYRFIIVEESFDSSDVALSRVDRLKDHDPGLDSKYSPELILRDGFSAGDRVLYATTDVSKFELEKLSAIVDSMRAHVLGTTKGEQESAPNP